MKKTITFLCLCLPLFCMTQSNPLARQYDYYAAGNRILRKVVNMSLPQRAPPAPQDSTLETRDNRDSRDPSPQTSYPTPQTSDLIPSTSHSSPLASHFYVEKIAQTEIKIYPNPTTEKITLEIFGWETLQTGIFKLYNLSGQLLQEQPVHSVSTEVSLANLPKGAYILKVQINDRIEDWKIIKN
jgi:hypothetical protein